MGFDRPFKEGITNHLSDTVERAGSKTIAVGIGSADIVPVT